MSPWIDPQSRFQKKTALYPGAIPAVTGNGHVLCGYWFEWEPRVALTRIPSAYNIVCISFLEEDDAPVFRPRLYSEEQMIAGIRALKAEGREVLVAIGGANGRIALRRDDQAMFKQELMRVIDQYGFTGVDIDLEGADIQAGDNPSVLPAILREMKDAYRSRNQRFLITVAPEFISLQGEDAAYQPYIEALEGYYDFIWPQYYNQGDYGLWSDEYQRYLPQNDTQYKSEFLYTLTHAILTGSQGFLKIPADKFAIGLPASPAAALNGYVNNPADVWQALRRLANEGHVIRGLMTWSVNHDAANDYEFARRYAPMLFG